MPQPTTEIDQFLSRKRSRKNQRYIAKLEKYAMRTKRRREEFANRFGPKSKIIEMLAKHGKKPLKAIDKYAIQVPIGKQFSILDDANSAIELINSFAFALHNGTKIRRIIFRHENLEEYDLAANALLDLITVERKAELQKRKSRKGLKVSGFYPKNSHVKRFIKAMGIIKHLDIAHEAPTETEKEKLRIFDSRNTHYFRNIDGKKADFKDREQEKFVDHIDKCLRDHGWELSDLGKQSLGVYTGEILANAEDHAGFVDWTVQGYLDNSTDPHICEIAIFNFGKSIAESLKELDKTSYTWGQIGEYVERHSKSNFFNDAWREEDLLTVVALQANVSRLNRSPIDTRGQGTVDLISFFQQIHQFCTDGKGSARMAIVSGSTYILFDGKHKLVERPDGGNIIAFNATNDLMEKPDPEYVRRLTMHFPGTIITIKFPLSLASGTLVEEL